MSQLKAFATRNGQNTFSETKLETTSKANIYAIQHLNASVLRERMQLLLDLYLNCSPILIGRMCYLNTCTSLYRMNGKTR